MRRAGVGLAVVLLGLSLGCGAPPRREAAPPPPAPARLAPGDLEVTGLRPPVARIGAPAAGHDDARVLFFRGERGEWRAEHMSFDDQDRAAQIFTAAGRSTDAARAELGWTLIVGRDGKQRYSGRLSLEARDKRHAVGTMTFDGIPGRADKLELEKVEDPLASE